MAQHGPAFLAARAPLSVRGLRRVGAPRLEWSEQQLLKATYGV
jgi:hypothetical protein